MAAIEATDTLTKSLSLTTDAISTRHYYGDALAVRCRHERPARRIPEQRGKEDAPEDWDDRQSDRTGPHANDDQAALVDEQSIKDGVDHEGDSEAGGMEHPEVSKEERSTKDEAGEEDDPKVLEVKEEDLEDHTK